MTKNRNNRITRSRLWGTFCLFLIGAGVVCVSSRALPLDSASTPRLTSTFGPPNPPPITPRPRPTPFPRP
jgi:hypothetical protein